MKPFNVKEYNANPSKKVITRNGKPVRILCTNAIRPYPIVTLVTSGDYEHLQSYKIDGKLYKESENPLDLFFVPEKKEGWTNIYIDINGQYSNGSIYNTKEEASKAAGFGFIATTKIEWEE